MHWKALHYHLMEYLEGNSSFKPKYLQGSNHPRERIIQEIIQENNLLLNFKRAMQSLMVSNEGQQGSNLHPIGKDLPLASAM